MANILNLLWIFKNIYIENFSWKKKLRFEIFFSKFEKKKNCIERKGKKEVPFKRKRNGISLSLNILTLSSLAAD